MPKSVTQFDLLISCPSDVEEELKIIEETVSEFNHMIAQPNHATIITKHWSKDSYPQPGDNPQNLLNEQFVRNCDAAVAVFWTRFGTPTDNYGSGTEEEIEELIKNGKQVFLYFSNRPVNPDDLDSEQYDKVKEFRKKYESRGIYASYSNSEEFKQKFLNALTLHFNEGHIDKPSHSSKLSINGVLEGKITEKPIMYKINYQYSKFMDNLKSKILDLFNQAKNITLPKKVATIKIPDFIDNDTRATILQLQKNVQHTIASHSMPGPVLLELEDDLKNKLQSFAKEFNIDINNSSDFFNIGKVFKTPKPFVNDLFNSEPSEKLGGSDEEIEKYKLLNILSYKITEYNSWRSYFQSLDSMFYIDLSLSNLGTSYDEDIDIKLCVKAGHLCTHKQLPIPGDAILEKTVNWIDRFFKPPKTSTVMAYDNYPTDFNTSLPVQDIFSDDEKYLKCLYEYETKEEYWKEINTIFCYEYFQEDGFDIICYKQPYIKQNTNIFFPSTIVFQTIPDTIHYEISSRHSPKVIKGELKPILEK